MLEPVPTIDESGANAQDRERRWRKCAGKKVGANMLAEMDSIFAAFRWRPHTKAQGGCDGSYFYFFFFLMSWFSFPLSLSSLFREEKGEQGVWMEWILTQVVQRGLPTGAGSEDNDAMSLVL